MSSFEDGRKPLDHYLDSNQVEELESEYTAEIEVLNGNNPQYIVHDELRDEIVAIFEVAKSSREIVEEILEYEEKAAQTFLEDSLRFKDEEEKLKIYDRENPDASIESDVYRELSKMR